MYKYKQAVFLGMLCLLLGGQVNAQSSSSSSGLPTSGSSLYGLTVTVDNAGTIPEDMLTQSFFYDNAEDMFELFEDDTLSTAFEMMGEFSGYEDTSIVDARINYQGILVELGYRSSNAVITFNVPELDITVQCYLERCLETDDEFAFLMIDANGNPALQEPLESGADVRDESQDALLDYLEESDVANRVNKLLAAASPTSPLAGNPSSLQSSLVSSAFSKGIDTADSDDIAGAQGTDAGGGGVRGVGNAFPLGLQFGRYSQEDYDVDNYTLPIRYAYRWADGKKISVDLPLTYIKIEDAEAYKAGLEIAYTHPISERWKLTPGIGYGLTFSEDLLAGAQMGSVSLTSLYTFDESLIGDSDWSLSVGNMIGYSQSFPLKISDINIAPDLSNQIIKNGLIIDARKTFVTPLNIRVYLTDTRFFGDELYSERYNEVGLFLSSAKRRYAKGSGLNFYYLFGEGDINGFNVAFSHEF